MGSPKADWYLLSLPPGMDLLQDASGIGQAIPLGFQPQFQLTSEQVQYYTDWIVNPLEAAPSYGHLSQGEQVLLEPFQSSPASQTIPDQQAVSLHGPRRLSCN